MLSLEELKILQPRSVGSLSKTSRELSFNLRKEYQRYLSNCHTSRTSKNECIGKMQPVSQSLFLCSTFWSLHKRVLTLHRDNNLSTCVSSPTSIPTCRQTPETSRPDPWMFTVTHWKSLRLGGLKQVKLTSDHVYRDRSHSVHVSLGRTGTVETSREE